MKNKILSILCIFILVSFIFINNNAFAVSYSTEFTEIYEYSYWNDFNNNVINGRPYFIVPRGDGSYALFAYPCELSYSHWNFETDDVYFYIKNGALICRNSTLNEETSHFSDYVLYSDSYDTVHTCWDLGRDFFTTDIIVNNSDIQLSESIYSDVERKEYFFSPVPVNLAQALELHNPMTSFQTMTRGMIPYLIVFLVGLVAFWKAWQLLLKELRKA